jgi:hypothetical protein
MNNISRMDIRYLNITEIDDHFHYILHSPSSKNDTRHSHDSLFIINNIKLPWYRYNTIRYIQHVQQMYENKYFFTPQNKKI